MPEPERDLLQEHVAEVVAEAVVHLLETVEVHHHQGQRLAVPVCAQERLLETVVQQRAVGKIGQSIVEGLVLERGLLGLALGDVLDHGDHELGLVVRAPDEGYDRVDPDRARVPAPVAELHLGLVAQALRKRHQLHGVDVARVDDLHEVEPVEVAGRVVEHRVKGAVGLDDAAPEVDPGDAHRRPVEHCPEPALALPQRRAAARLFHDRGREARDRLHQVALEGLDLVIGAPAKHEGADRGSRGVHRGRGQRHGAFRRRHRESVRVAGLLGQLFQQDRLALADRSVDRAARSRGRIPPVIGLVAPDAFPAQLALPQQRDGAVISAQEQARALDDQPDGTLDVGLGGSLPHELGQRLGFGALAVGLGVEPGRLQRRRKLGCEQGQELEVVVVEVAMLVRPDREPSDRDVVGDQGDGDD